MNLLKMKRAKRKNNKLYTRKKTHRIHIKMNSIWYIAVRSFYVLFVFLVFFLCRRRSSSPGYLPNAMCLFEPSRNEITAGSTSKLPMLLFCCIQCFYAYWLVSLVYSMCTRIIGLFRFDPCVYNKDSWIKYVNDIAFYRKQH